MVTNASGGPPTTVSGPPRRSACRSGGERPREWDRALITGASSGIGKAFARCLARSGTDLCLVARSRDRLERLAEELSTAHGIGVEVVPADLTDRRQRPKVERRLARADDPFDLLINNAGFGTTGPFWQLPREREQDEVELNVVAVMRLAHAVLPGMVARGRGGMCNVASIAGISPTPMNATYGATKAFVLSFSDALHEELIGSGVRVTAVVPGFTRTGFQDTADYESPRALPRRAWLEPEQVAMVALEDLARGRARSVAGAGYKALAGALSVLPPTVRRRLVGESVRRLGDPHEG